jgi:YfiH family protein
MCYTDFMMMSAVARSVYPVTLKNLLLYRVAAFDTHSHLTHAIFTRQGGYSQAPFDTLNLGVSVGDDLETVKKNYGQVCQAINISPEQTVSCHLIHSADILTINRADCQQVMGQADGLITATPGIYLSMRFADCTPLIFFDPVRGAVGLTHAGWRGTMQNAAGATVRAMVEQLGCRAGDIIGVIGPAIGPCCYEVGPEVLDAAAQAFPNAATLFTQRNGRPGHAYFDMWEANRRQLQAAGLEQIIPSGLCTACRTDEFFSHRAERGRTGRFGVIIGLRGGAV